MPIPWLVASILTPRCISLLLQRPLFFEWWKPFLTIPSLPWPCQDPPWGLCHFMYEVGDIVICPMRCRYYCSVQIWATYWADFWQPLWCAFFVKCSKLQGSKNSQIGTPWLLQRAAITLALTACNLFFPDVVDSFDLGSCAFHIFLWQGKCVCGNVMTLVSA